LQIHVDRFDSDTRLQFEFKPLALNFHNSLEFLRFWRDACGDFRPHGGKAKAAFGCAKAASRGAIGSFSFGKVAARRGVEPLLPG
jgi:hypothetical protein